MKQLKFLLDWLYISHVIEVREGLTLTTIKGPPLSPPHESSPMTPPAQICKLSRLRSSLPSEQSLMDTMGTTTVIRALLILRQAENNEKYMNYKLIKLYR
jgi:hypothetical protein